MKKSKISFRVIGDSGPLTISWFEGPKGDAVEAKNGIGVGFFSSDGTLLCVEFDDVKEKHDNQTLEFDRYRVEVSTNQGKVAFKAIDKPVSGRKKTNKNQKDEDAA